MSLVADPAWHAQIRDEGLVVYAGADLAYLIPDLPRAVAVALAGLFEPVLRGVARTVDESRLGGTGSPARGPAEDPGRSPPGRVAI